MPFKVTFTLVASLPRMRIPVYPTPAPASEVTTTPGVLSSRKGKSCPKLFFAIVSLSMFLNVAAEFVAARVALTTISFARKVKGASLKSSIMFA